MFCIIIVFLAASFYACLDMMHFSLRLNEEKKYRLNCNNNQIELRLTVNMGSHYQFLIKSLQGEFDFYTDSLNIITRPTATTVYSYFKYGKKSFSGHQTIEKGKTLICYFSIYGDYSYGSPGCPEEILIPPSGFIMCDDKPLITDTIRINMKQ
ncbi:hypothetical protein [Candidatus Symbiothrix dinenymphae]|uniref:hypothetical protein n=1 Tax=Candidatus Symbiothrix dinenymphae TaxID=467085 RepID=UPI000A5A40A5|nr:hypothetical protein [Candidatus Symbiothrix dinenymphae]